MSLSFIILAAGKGTRMQSDLPKVLHPLAGAPLLAHSLRTAAGMAPQKTVIVAGHRAEMVRYAAGTHFPQAEIVVQDQQLGTGHAVKTARRAFPELTGDAIVLYGDTPFISPKTLALMLKKRREGAAVVVLGFRPETPGRYGRLVLDADGALLKIVEAKDASVAERAIDLCNSGVICAPTALLFELVDAIGNDNASGEYYLTDIVALARKAGQNCAVVTCAEQETLGINARSELARAEAAFQARARADALANGVTLQAPETVFFAYDTVIGRDVEIGPNVVFGPGVTVESGAHIRAFCHLEGCHVSRGAIVGPFARLRPGAEVAEHAHIGNFVEIKNALIGEGAKVNHLSYVGDSDIGSGANIGAGTITCNYDGVMKHRTVIGANAFIGSNTALVAPVRIGAGAMTGSGAVITRDVPDDALALARAEQVTRKGFVARYMARLRAIKARKSKNTKL